MTDTSGEPPVRRTRAGVLAGGVVLGVLLAWFSFVVLVSATPVASEGPAGAALALVLPAVVGIALLAHPRTRQAGTGFLLGLAVGMITGAGVCGLTIAALS